MVTPGPFAKRLYRWPTTLTLVVLAAYGSFSLPGLVEKWGPSAGGLALFAAWAMLAAWALMLAVRPAPTRQWLLFGAGACALRIGSAMLAAPRVSPGDSHWYLVIAHNLLAGRGWSMVEPYMGIETHALFPPGYATLLAGWGALFGFGTPALLGLSALIDAAASWTMLRIARAIGAPRAGVAAAALYLVWPAVLFDAPLAQKESLCTLLVLLIAQGWLAALIRPRGWRDALAIGLPTACLALTQPGELLLALFIGLALTPLFGWARVMRIGMAAALCAGVAMLPWWVRNWLVFGAFVPLTSASGLSLWIGNNPDATGNWLPYPPQLRGLPELAYGKAAAALARDWITAHPADFARLTIAKFLRAVAIGQSGVARLAAMHPPISAAIGAALLPVAHFSHLLLLWLGAVSAQLRRDRAALVLLALLGAGLAQLALVGVWFEFGERHRAFLTPFVLLPVAAAWPQIVGWVARVRAAQSFAPLLRADR